jgi:hypothetical protein
MLRAATVVSLTASHSVLRRSNYLPSKPLNISLRLVAFFIELPLKLSALGANKYHKSGAIPRIKSQIQTRPKDTSK